MSDLIDRSEVIAVINSMFAKSLAKDRALDAVNSVPPAQRWIPCAERLPDESGKYLVTAFEGTVKITTIVLFQSTYRLWGLTGRRAYWKVIAWMPLPDPWEEGYE